MPDSNASINFSFNLNSVVIAGIPQQSSIYNQYDDFGLIVGLNRLPKERNQAYKQRLLDTFANRANSTYIGMMNAITRELGLTYFKPFRLRPRVSGNTFIGENPVYVFNGPFLELWRDKYNAILEMRINLFDQSGPVYTINELYTYINTNSAYFIADQLDTNHQYDRSLTIMNQSNVQLIKTEPLFHMTRFTLSNPGTDAGNIDINTLHFTDTFTFNNKVSSVNLVLNQGDYYINSYTGDIVVFSEPENGSTVRYNYIKYNSSYLLASPIIIHNIQNPYFQKVMFEQVLADDGIYYNGLPTEFGADLINELLSVYPLYFTI
jgi:hypothetical protein